MRDSFIFYGSFLEALDELPPDIQLQVYQAVTRYAIKGELSELTGIAKAVFSLIKPQLDANTKRYNDGCKGGEYGKLGGRPAKNKDIKNPSGVIDKNPTKTPNENENENENENVKVEVEEKKEEEIVEIKKQKELVNFYGEYGNVFLTQKSYDVLFALTMDEIILKTLINELSEAIARKSDRYKPYDEKFPDAHFCYLKAFWRQRKEHPEKFLPKNSADTGGNFSKKSEINAVIAFLNKQKDKNK